MTLALIVAALYAAGAFDGLTALATYFTSRRP